MLWLTPKGVTLAPESCSTASSCLIVLLIYFQCCQFLLSVQLIRAGRDRRGHSKEEPGSRGPPGALLPLLVCLLLPFFLTKLFIYLFFGCIGSSLLHAGFLVAVSRGYSSLWCTGLLRWLLLLRSMGSRHTGFSSCGMQAQ